MGKRRYVSNDEFNKALNNEDNIKMIKSITGRYANILSEEDRRSAGLDGLWRALGYHQEGKGNKFTTSLYMFLNHECRRWLAQQNRYMKTQSLTDNLPAKSDNPDIVDLRNCIDNLDSSEKLLIVDYYINKKSLSLLSKENNDTIDNTKIKIAQAFSKLKTLVGV